MNHWCTIYEPLLSILGLVNDRTVRVRVRVRPNLGGSVRFGRTTEPRRFGKPNQNRTKLLYKRYKNPTFEWKMEKLINFFSKKSIFFFIFVVNIITLVWQFYFWDFSRTLKWLKKFCSEEKVWFYYCKVRFGFGSGSVTLVRVRVRFGRTKKIVVRSFTRKM